MLCSVVELRKSKMATSLRPFVNDGMTYFARQILLSLYVTGNDEDNIFFRSVSRIFQAKGLACTLGL